jgi:hypothetical protein
MKSPTVIELENAGIIIDAITICPHCKQEVTSIKWQLGCCGGSSDDFIEGYLFKDNTFLTETQIEILYKSTNIH